MTTRAEIRKHIRRQRRQLSQAEQQTASQAIVANLANSRVFRNSRRIAGFFSNDGEPDLIALMHLAWRLKKIWHLPVIGLPNLDRLWFAPYHRNDSLTLNRFGIAEPDKPLHDATRSYGLDLILMPLVAFDPHGNRLGMGKGYYDRSFEFLRLRQHWRKPRLVGIAFELQKVEQLPVQPWDIPLDAIVTEKTVYNVRQLEF